LWDLQKDLAPFRWWKLGEIVYFLNVSIRFYLFISTKKINKIEIWWPAGLFSDRYVVMVVMFGCMLSVTKFPVNFSRYHVSTVFIFLLLVLFQLIKKEKY